MNVDADNPDTITAPDHPEAVTTDAQPAPQAQDDAPSAEDRAMAMGWTPKGQFKGDPDKWVDAETFVKRGEEFLPFLKANNRRLEQALEKGNAQLEQMDKALKGAIQHISRADKRAYEAARRDLESELDRAAEAGDAAAVRAVTQDIVTLEKDTADKAEPAAPDEDPVFAAWKAANPWYGTDEVMTAAAVALGNRLYAEGYTGKAQADEVTKRIKAEFPHKFDNPNRRQPSVVEGGTGQGRKPGKTYADLPPEAKAMCDSFVRDIKGFTKEKFVKDYDWS